MESKGPISQGVLLDGMSVLGVTFQAGGCAMVLVTLVGWLVELSLLATTCSEACDSLGSVWWREQSLG